MQNRITFEKFLQETNSAKFIYSLIRHTMKNKILKRYSIRMEKRKKKILATTPPKEQRVLLNQKCLPSYKISKKSRIKKKVLK